MNKAIQEYQEKFDMGPMIPHKEFMKDVEHFGSLPAQTCRALGPESQEDYAVYTTDETGGKDVI